MNGPTRSVGYPEQCRERARASKALTYLIAVADGDVEDPDPRRIDTCKYLLNKAWPDLPRETVNYQSERIPDYIVQHGD